ncbi:hypothetical protein BDV96DRAFT_644751 [Lophiotrema nucula]|uniref:RRM domain-containing protein n=1 Tax=Lophiotrema nucula TaxID=690887 RepID=A0A6A5ZDM0_9PLEO|nr:hypothetical protein BDV96DRAFT_644751 [Lophiotrema nucula]
MAEPTTNTRHYLIASGPKNIFTLSGDSIMFKDQVSRYLGESRAHWADLFDALSGAHPGGKVGYCQLNNKADGLAAYDGLARLGAIVHLFSITSSTKKTLLQCNCNKFFPGSLDAKSHSHESGVTLEGTCSLEKKTASQTGGYSQYEKTGYTYSQVHMDPTHAAQGYVAQMYPIEPTAYVPSSYGQPLYGQPASGRAYGQAAYVQSAYQQYPQPIQSQQQSNFVFNERNLPANPSDGLVANPPKGICLSNLSLDWGERQLCEWFNSLSTDNQIAIENVKFLRKHGESEHKGRAIVSCPSLKAKDMAQMVNQSPEVDGRKIAANVEYAQQNWDAPLIVTSPT